MKTAVLLPTNHPQSFAENFLPSLTRFKGLEAIRFNIVFQENYTSDMVNGHVRAIQEAGFEVSYDSRAYDRSVCTDLLGMRNDCALLDTDCDLYLSIDDDIAYNGQFAKIFGYAVSCFEDDGELGYVQLCHESPIYGGVCETENLNGCYDTELGQLFRNCYKNIVADRVAHLKGGLECGIIPICRVQDGYKTKHIYSSVGRHLDAKPTNCGVYGWGKEAFDGSVAKYLRGVKVERRHPAKFSIVNI